MFIEVVYYFNLLEKRLIPLRHFKKGNVVGTKNFFTQRQNEYSAKATKFIEIVYI
jgi:hypothetical protein